MTQDKLQYRGFTGSIEYSEEHCVFFGKVLDIKEEIHYYGYTTNELTCAFIEVIDDYFVTYEVVNNVL